MTYYSVWDIVDYDVRTRLEVELTLYVRGYCHKVEWLPWNGHDPTMMLTEEFGRELQPYTYYEGQFYFVSAQDAILARLVL